MLINFSEQGCIFSLKTKIYFLKRYIRMEHYKEYYIYFMLPSIRGTPDIKSLFHVPLLILTL